LQRDGGVIEWIWQAERRKQFLGILREHLDPVLGRPHRRTKTVLHYFAPVGRWYFSAHVDLGGQSLLTYSHSIYARSPVDLAHFPLSQGHCQNLLDWCGVHPSTDTNLIPTDQFEDIALLLQETTAYALKSSAGWLSGIDHSIPEVLEDEDTWMQDRLARPIHT
jgi:hypothetical protein